LPRDKIRTDVLWQTEPKKDRIILLNTHRGL